jgi:hypothetical protein
MFKNPEFSNIKDELLLFVKSKEIPVHKIEENINKVNDEFERDIKYYTNFEIPTIKEKPGFAKEKERIYNTSSYKELKRIYNNTENQNEMIDGFVKENLFSEDKENKIKKEVREFYLFTLWEELEAKKTDDKNALKEIDKFRIFLADISSKLNANTKLKDNEGEEEKSYDELITIIADSVGKPKETIEKEIYQKPNSEKLLANLLETVMDPNSQDEPEIVLQKFYKEKIAHA